MKLTEKQLYRAWEYAHETLVNTIRPPRGNEKTYLTSCWLEGILRSLKESGYEITLTKIGEKDEKL